MSKKHFIALADRLICEQSHFVTYYSQDAFNAMVDIICRFCRGENFRFNEDRFRSYIAGECGPNGGRVRGGK